MLLKKGLWHRGFPVNFAEFLRIPFFINRLQWLPLPFDANVSFYFTVFQHSTIIIPDFCKALRQCTSLPRNGLISYFEGKVYTYWFNTYWTRQSLRWWDAELNHLKPETSTSNAGFQISSRRAIRGGESSTAFFGNQNFFPDFGWKALDCVHLWVKFSIQNVVWRVFRRRNTKLFPCGPFFLMLLTKYLSKCPNNMKPLLLWKIFDCTCLRICWLERHDFSNMNFFEIGIAQYLILISKMNHIDPLNTF